MRLLLTATVLCAVSFAHAADTFALGDFETGTWDGLRQSNEPVKQGAFSGEWADLGKPGSIRAPQCPTDLTGYDGLVFWLHSAVANGQVLTLIFQSENPEQEGWDYFFHHLRIDWQGWRRVNLSLKDDFGVSRHPRGWDQIEYFAINSGGWDHHPLKDSLLHFDDIKLVRDPVDVALQPQQTRTEQDGGLTVLQPLSVTNLSGAARSFALEGARVNADGAAGAFQLEGLPATTPEIAAGETATITVTLRAATERLASAAPLQREEFIITVKLDDPNVPDTQLSVGAAVPLAHREHPFLLGDAELFDRCKQRAEKYEWAKSQLDSILSRAEAALSAEFDVPDEPGQWSHHYVCKKCGARLKHEDGKHICVRCGEVYTGWPYDQVVVAGRHHRAYTRIRDLGLGYAFTGKEEYAQKAREYLLAYADIYTTLPIHNVRGVESNSGGRVYAQTLDESVAIIQVAWGYDLIYNSPCLSDGDRQAIEGKFLREVVKTVQHHDAGISNWQSWHNAGIAAVGFCIQDDAIASAALNGKSGLCFQLKNSILSDGFWHEGTAAYHYYALDALRWTTEVAYHAGISFYDDAAYKALYDAPLLFTFPDLNFPAINDSDVFSIKGRHALYDLAYARFGDPAYLGVAQHGARKSLEAFLWGVEQLPEPPQVALQSKDFSGLGAAVLRQGAGDDQLYLHLDYGPHGGGHGHPDKLALTFWGLGVQLAPDPGRLAYAAPLQGSWYKQTFAHNTICIDQQNQQHTEGKLTAFESEPGLAIARAECDTAYPDVAMDRTNIMTDRYLLDVFTIRADTEHTYDWLWHNFGTLTAGLETMPLGSPLHNANGYQHFRDITTAATDADLTATFALEGVHVDLTMLGASGTEVYFGMGMSNNPPVDCPMLLARRTGTDATFITLIEPHRGTRSIESIERLPVMGDDVAIAVEVTHIGGRIDTILIAGDAERERTFAGHTTTARIAWFSTAADTAPKKLELE